MDRIAIDKTGISGKFDFHLEFVPDPDMRAQNLPNLFVALQEQLGLKLSSDKGSVSVQVIDYVARPSAN